MKSANQLYFHSVQKSSFCLSGNQLLRFFFYHFWFKYCVHRCIFSYFAKLRYLKLLTSVLTLWIHINFSYIKTFHSNLSQPSTVDKINMSNCKTKTKIFFLLIFIFQIKIFFQWKYNQSLRLLCYHYLICHWTKVMLIDNLIK